MTKNTLNLSGRTRYRGWDYVKGGDVVRTGREWKERAAELAELARVRRDPDGAIAVYKGALRQFEVYP